VSGLQIAATVAGVGARSNDWREGVMHHKFIVADVVSTARGLDLDATVL
jgi:hypothetical protein